MFYHNFQHQENTTYEDSKFNDAAMRAIGVFVAAALVCGAWQTAADPADSGECASAARFDLTLRSSRNASGHAHTRVRLRRAPPAATAHGAPPPPIEMAVRHGEYDAGGAYFELEFTEGPPLRAPVPDGYERFAGVGAYRMHAEGATWWEARAVCEAEGAHLAVINSQKEEQVLVHLYERTPSPQGLSDANHAFLGFHDFYAEGQFVTIFGEALNETGFTRWSGPNQPDNFGFGVNPDSDCGGMHRKGGLNDLPCNWKCVFFCEYPLKETGI